MKFLLALILSSSLLHALPKGGEVIKGSAKIQGAQKALNIDANGSTVINWDQFDIAQSEMVSFKQAQSRCAVLNRVTGGSASQILGKLEANCPLFLVNPQGVYIGSSAEVVTAGFIASTAELSNWKEHPCETLGPGKIVNLGKVSSSRGDIVLIARSIDNQGTLEAPEGTVTLKTEVMLPDGGQKIYVRLEEEEGIKNSGEIHALAVEFKTKSPYERAIRHEGTITAYATKEEKGRIYLVAKKGGCEVDGSLCAEGGTISAKGKTLQVGAKGHFLASGIGEENGGTVIIHSKEATDFRGRVEVRGGPDGGNGGEAHISTEGEHFWVEGTSGFIDAKAPKGMAGKVIFDPKFVTISSSGTDPATGQTFSSDPSGTANISGATLESALDGADVTIQANTDITFADTVNNAVSGRRLELEAGRSINFTGTLTMTNGDFSAKINDEGAEAANRDSGVAIFSMSNGGAVDTQGGDIWVGIGTYGGTQVGEVQISDGTLDAGAGTIVVTGIGRQDGSDNVSGISISGNSTITTSGRGGILLNGTGGNGVNNNVGISIGSSTSSIQTESGVLYLSGRGGGNSSGASNVAIHSSGLIESLDKGAIILEGTGGAGISGNTGIVLTGIGAQVNTVNGDITLHGFGGGTGTLNHGIHLELGASCSSTGGGVVSLLGTSATGTDSNYGTLLSSGTLTSATGSIYVDGLAQGSGDTDHGVLLEGTTQITSTGTAPISIHGDNLAGQDSNIGVLIKDVGLLISSVSGNISIEGKSAGTGALNQGVRIEGGITQSTGTGAGAATILLKGTSGPGTTDCVGVAVEGVLASVTSVDGDITVDGVSLGNGAGSQPILISPPTAVSTTGSGVITLIE